MTANRQDGRVLVVDDEDAVADLYATWVGAEYETLTAYDGERALELVDDDVDVVLLDRQMPGRSGDQVLDVIDDRDLDCRVVMVTAVDPDFDIVEMPFDDYLIKPVTRAELRDSIDEMVTRATYDEQMQEYFALVSKLATLESRKSPGELAESDAYAEMKAEVEAHREQVDQTVGQVESVESLFHELPGDD